MPTINELRQQYPGYADLRDEDIINDMAAANNVGSDVMAAFLGWERPTFGKEAVRAVKRTAGSLVGGVGEMYGDVSGNRDNALARYGHDVEQANPSGINSLRDVADYPMAAVGNALGNAGMMILPGAGLKIAGNVARGAKMLNTARALDNPLTQAAVAGLPSLSEIGESQRESGLPENYALKYLGAGAVGAIENLGGVQRMMGLGRAPQVLSKADEVAQFGATPWRTVGKTMLRSGLEEGLEEIPQTFIEKGAGYQDPFSAKNLEEAALGGVLGSIGGGVLGAGHGAARGLRHAQIRRDQSVDLLAQGADLGRISDQVQWTQAFMNKAGENGDAWFDQRMNSINQQRLGEAVQNNFTAGLGNVALEDSAMQGPFRTPVDELLWNRQREITAAQRANLGTTPDMFGGEDSYGYIGESSPVDYGPAVNRDRKQMSLDFNPPEAPPPVLYGNQNQPYAESFNNSREGKFNPTLNSRAAGSPMTGAFTQLPIGETGAQVVNRLPASQQVNESVSHPMFPTPTDVGSALATLQQALGQKTPVIEGTQQHSAILAASQILARAGVKLPKGGRATQTQPVAAQAAATTQQKAQPKPAAAPAAKVTQPRGKFSQAFQAKLEAAVAEGKVAPDDPIVTDWHASKKLKADAQSFGQALDDKLAGPTVLPMSAEQALQTKAKNAVAEVKAGGLNLTMKQIPVFDHLQKAFAENRVDDVIGADGKWKYNEIGKALGIERGKVMSRVNGVANMLAANQGVSVDEMKAALKARTAEVRTTEMSEKDKLGMSPKQQSSVFNEEDLFGNENGAEQNAEVINTVGGSQSAVGTNEAPTDLVVNRPDAPEVVANRAQAAEQSVREAVDEAVNNPRLEEALSTWDELSEEVKGVAPNRTEIDPRSLLEWVHSYTQLTEEFDGPFEDYWDKLRDIHSELIQSAEEENGRTTGEAEASRSIPGVQSGRGATAVSRGEVREVQEGQPVTERAAGRSDTEGQAGEVNAILSSPNDKGVESADRADKAKADAVSGNTESANVRGAPGAAGSKGVKETRAVRSTQAENDTSGEVSVSVVRSRVGDAKLALADAVEKWKLVVANLAAGKLDTTRQHEMFATTPASMQVLGMPNLPVLAKFHALKYLNQRITQSGLESLPEEMANPVVVLMHEETDGTLSFNFVTRLTSGSDFVSVAVQPNTHDPRGGHANYVATIITPSRQTILRELRQGRAAYVGDLNAIEGAAAAFQQGKKESGRESVKFRDAISRKFKLPTALTKVIYKSDSVKLIDNGTALYRRETLTFSDSTGKTFNEEVEWLDEANYPDVTDALNAVEEGPFAGVLDKVEGFCVGPTDDAYVYKNTNGTYKVVLPKWVLSGNRNTLAVTIDHELAHVADDADAVRGGVNSSGAVMGVMTVKAKALYDRLPADSLLKKHLDYPFNSKYPESKSAKLQRVELYAQLAAARLNPELAAELKAASPALYNFAETIVDEIQEQYPTKTETESAGVRDAGVAPSGTGTILRQRTQATERTPSGTFSKIGEKLDELVSDPRQFFSELKLGFTTLEQVAEATKSAAVNGYRKAMVAMQMKEKDIVHKASQIDLKWADLAKDAAVFKRLNSVMTESTLAEYDPSKTKPTNDRERAIYQDWNLLPKDAKDQYVTVRKFYEDNLELRKSFMEDLEKKAKLQGKELDQFRQWYAKVKGPYFPLVRIGDYYAVGMSKRTAELMDKKRDGLLSSAEEAELSKLRKDPKHYTTSSFNSLREAKKWAKDNAGTYHTTRFNKSEEKFTMGDLNLPGLPQLEAYINAEMPAEIRGEVRDMIAKLAFEMAPEGSHLKRMMNREGVAGYEQDMRKAFAASSISQAHYISRLMHNQDVSAALQEVRNEGRDDLNMRSVYNELVKRAKLASTPDTTGKIVTGLTNVSYLAHLGLSPAFVLTNMTQVPMITTPWLGARHGFTRAASEIAKAYGEAFNIINTSYKEGGYQTDLHWGKLFKPGSDIDKMLTTLRDRNVLEITMEHDLGVVANMGGTSKLSDVNKMLNTPVRATEYANRVVTALAAYRLAIADKKSHDEAVEHAAKAVSQTQLNYSELNAPRLMRTVLGSKSLAKVVFQFRKYQQGMLWLVASNVGKAFSKQPDLKGDTLKAWQQERSEARRFTLGIFGLMQLMAGTTGLPFIGSIGFLANMVAAAFGDDDDPWDWETELRNFYHDAFGKEVGDVLSKGILMGVGLDMSTRIGMGNLASPLPFARSGNNGRETVGNVLTAAGGAPVGTIVDTIDGLKLLASGDGAKATEKLVPLKAAKDMLKGYRYADEGMTDTRGNVVLPPEKFDAWDIALRSTGFTPEIESTYYAANEAVQSAKFAASDKRHKLIQAYSRAQLDGKDVNDIREKIAAFNERHPEKGVRIDHSALIKSTQAVRKLAAGRNDAGIRDDKATAPFMDRARFATE